MNKINVAVIGYGHLGKWHTQKAFNHESINLVAIVESFEVNKLKAKADYPEVKISSDIKDIIEDIDAAIIVTPTSTHYELSKYLLENDKHVFCEKPLCSSSKEAQDLKNYLSDGQILQVGHSERCHEAWELLKEEIDNIKGPMTVKLTRAAAFKGRATDVDVVQDLMIHDLDLCHYLFNKKIVSVKAIGHKIRTSKWDHATAILETEDKSIFEITSGRNHIKEIRSLEIMSDNGCIYVDLFTNEIFKADGKSTEETGFVKASSYNKRDHLNIEQDNFYKSILGNTKPMVTYEDGAYIVGLIDKVLESLDSSTKISI